MENGRNLALVVEDDLQTAEIFDAAISGAGYRTEVFRDGQSALDRLQGNDETPLLVVLDLHLPNISGDKILDYIVQDEKLKDTRVIIASADGGLAKLQQYKKEKNILIMLKPVSFAQLLQLSKRFLPQGL
jgi:CheY-like chemotaxis protein